jgi:hypothetical protein
MNLWIVFFLINVVFTGLTRTRCGLDEATANLNCGTDCITSDDCTPPEECFPNLLSCTRCGLNWADAVQSCKNDCRIDGDCNGESCYSGLPTCTPAVINPNSTQRCGANWTDAAVSCKKECKVEGQCTPEHCYDALPVCNIVAPTPVVIDTGTRCGQNWTDAAATCKKTCTNDAQCTSPEKCFTNVPACLPDAMTLSPGNQINPLYWIIPLLCVIVIIAIFLAVVYYKNRKLKSKVIGLPDLPNNWLWDIHHLTDSGYKVSKTEPVYYYKRVEPNSKEEKLLNALLENLDVGVIRFSSSYAISNMTLAQNFSNHRKLQAQRMQESRSLFFKRDWDKKSSPELREKTISQFQNYIAMWDWNKDLDISDSPIVVAAHGTSAKTGWKIVSSGFAALSTLDDGYYGNGIYFSSHCTYTVPYFSVHGDPCLIICSLIPGNPYPVIEPPNDENSVKGSNLITGYQSHYVVTRTNGYPFTQEDYDSENPSFDEIVVFQEAQVLPLFLLVIDSSNIRELITAYQRQIPQVTKPNNNKDEVSIPIDRNTDIRSTSSSMSLLGGRMSTQRY